MNILLHSALLLACQRKPALLPAWKMLTVPTVRRTTRWQLRYHAVLSRRSSRHASFNDPAACHYNLGNYYRMRTWHTPYSTTACTALRPITRGGFQPGTTRRNQTSLTNLQRCSSSVGRKNSYRAKAVRPGGGGALAYLSSLFCWAWPTGWDSECGYAR